MSKQNLIGGGGRGRCRGGPNKDQCGPRFQHGKNSSNEDKISYSEFLELFERALPYEMVLPSLEVQEAYFKYRKGVNPFKISLSFAILALYHLMDDTNSAINFAFTTLKSSTDPRKHCLMGKSDKSLGVGDGYESKGCMSVQITGNNRHGFDQFEPILLDIYHSIDKTQEGLLEEVYRIITFLAEKLRRSEVLTEVEKFILLGLLYPDLNTPRPQCPSPLTGKDIGRQETFFQEVLDFLSSGSPFTLLKRCTYNNMLLFETVMFFRVGQIAEEHQAPVKEAAVAEANRLRDLELSSAEAAVIESALAECRVISNASDVEQYCVGCNNPDTECQCPTYLPPPSFL